MDNKQVMIEKINGWATLSPQAQEYFDVFDLPAMDAPRLLVMGSVFRTEYNEAFPTYRAREAK